jgi:hypothetical protein
LLIYILILLYIILSPCWNCDAEFFRQAAVCGACQANIFKFRELPDGFLLQLGIHFAFLRVIIYSSSQHRYI